MRLFRFFVTNWMGRFLNLIEVFSGISNGLEQVHLSDDITIRTTGFWSDEDTDKDRPDDHEHDNGDDLSTDDGQYIDECMETGSQEESDDTPEYEEEELSIAHDPGGHIFSCTSIYPAQLREIPPSKEECEKSCKESMANTSEENTLQMIERHDIIVSDRLTHRKSHTDRDTQENNLTNRARLHDLKRDIKHDKFYYFLRDTMSDEIAKTGHPVHARTLEEAPNKHRHPIPNIMPRDGKRKHPCIDSRRRTRQTHNRTDNECCETSECKSNYVVYPWHHSQYALFCGQKQETVSSNLPYRIYSYRQAWSMYHNQRDIYAPLLHTSVTNGIRKLLLFQDYFC